MFFLAVTRISLSTGVYLPPRPSGFDANFYLHGPRSQSCPSLPLPRYLQDAEEDTSSYSMTPRTIAIHVAVSTTKSTDEHSLAPCQDWASCPDKMMAEEDNTSTTGSEGTDNVNHRCPAS